MITWFVRISKLLGRYFAPVLRQKREESSPNVVSLLTPQCLILPALIKSPMASTCDGPQHKQQSQVQKHLTHPLPHYFKHFTFSLDVCLGCSRRLHNLHLVTHVAWQCLSSVVSTASTLQQWHTHSVWHAPDHFVRHNNCTLIFTCSSKLTAGRSFLGLYCLWPKRGA